METPNPNEKAAEDLFGGKDTPILKKPKEAEDEQDLAFAYAEYDRFSFIASKVLKFRNKTIEEWLEATAIPTISPDISLDEMEKLNLFAINLIETVNKNYSYAKSSFDLSALKYAGAYQKEKISLIQQCKDAKTKVPNADLLETITVNNIKDIYLAQKIAELFYEFWRGVHAKVKSFDGRLTSISMIHNAERKSSKHES